MQEIQVLMTDAARPPAVNTGAMKGNSIPHYLPNKSTDVLKALALGADAVCVGRAYIWGLAAFGQAGVEKVLEMLSAELSMVMGQMGARSVSDIGPQHIGFRGMR